MSTEPKWEMVQISDFEKAGERFMVHRLAVPSGWLYHVQHSSDLLGTNNVDHHLVFVPMDISEM